MSSQRVEKVFGPSTFISRYTDTKSLGIYLRKACRPSMWGERMDYAVSVVRELGPYLQHIPNLQIVLRDWIMKVTFMFRRDPQDVVGSYRMHVYRFQADP